MTDDKITWEMAATYKGCDCENCKELEREIDKLKGEVKYYRFLSDEVKYYKFLSDKKGEKQ